MFYRDLNKFNNLNPQKESQKEKIVAVYNNGLEPYNEYLDMYFNKYEALSIAEKRKLGNKYVPINLFLKTCHYNVWFENKKLTDTTSRKSSKNESVDLSDMPPLEGDKEVKDGEGSEILTSNKLLTRLPISLAQIKVGNNLYKLEI